MVSWASEAEPGVWALLLERPWLSRIVSRSKRSAGGALITTRRLPIKEAAVEEMWIHIPNWDEFQHPDVGRSNRTPVWIRNYTRLLHKDAYLELTAHQRGVLHGLWMLYALSGCQLRANTASLTRQLAVRVSSAQLKALVDAGFIEVSACRPQAQKRREEKYITRASTSTTDVQGNGPGDNFHLGNILKEIQ